MSGAAYILVVNLLVAGLFSATFMLIALYDRRQVSARWFGAAYASGMVYATVEFLIPLFSDGRVGVFLGHSAFLVTLLLVNVGIARHYKVEVPRRLLTAAFSISLVISALSLDFPRQSFERMLLYQAPYFAMQAIAALIVLKATNRRLIDNILAGFLALGALHYLSKPVLSMVAGGPGSQPQDYLGTTYALISQSMATIMVVATALLLLAMLTADLLKDITAKSETDILSGLLNRRGFEQRLAEVVGYRAVNGLPLALVICDLDHFKAVNDNWGHAVGDRLIAHFAATLRDVASSHHVLGRIGGEEFAVILPGSNLAASRLFAEAVRSAFAARTLDDLPADAHFTASFGVAQLSMGEGAAAFMIRADAALYEAKRAGRDCVRVSRVHQIIDDGRSNDAR